MKTSGEDGFTYFSIEGKNDVIVVRVPEPRALMLQLAALVCIVITAGRKPDRRR